MMKNISIIGLIAFGFWAGQTMADQIYNENVTAQGNQCIGYDCVNNEDFGSDVLRLKENNNRIRFWDSASSQSEIQSLEIIANDSSNGGDNHFSFEHSQVLPVFGDGVTEGFDSEGNFRVIGVDEQLYSSENGGNSNHPNLAPLWTYENTSLLKLKKGTTAEAITLGQGSTSEENAISVGADTLLRQIKNVAQGLADSDLLITGLINHYDPIDDQKTDVIDIQVQLTNLATQITQLENWVTNAEQQDTDEDGLNDYIDTDDDDDGVLDVEDAFQFDENEQQDNDNDGTGDNSDTDDDNDTVLDINDAFPFDENEQVDTDGDGIGNNTDNDDDNDGISDDDEGGDQDLDNDGIPNSQDSDSDNDGIPDVDENGDFNNDGINDSQQTEGDIDSFGGGSISYGYLLIGLLLVRKRSLMVLFGMFSISVNTQAVNTQTSSNDCLNWVLAKSTQCFYLGLGTGTSVLQADTDSTGWESKDSSKQNMSVFLGRKISENWSAQIGYSQLGSSDLTHNNPTITGSQSIDYDAKHLKAARTLWNNGHGFSLGANGGLAWLTSKASSGINLAEQEAVKTTFGLAANWRFANGWQAQAQANHYVETASVFNLALVYQFGQSDLRLLAGSQEVSSPQEKNDLVLSAVSPQPPQVCERLSGNQLTLYFDKTSHHLNTQSQHKLNNWLATLEHKNQIEYMLEGHSDQQGTALNNLKYSKLRAKNVATILARHGFSKANLNTQGSGEFNLASENEPSLNRRVEIWVMQDKHCEMKTETPRTEVLVEGSRLH